MTLRKLVVVTLIGLTLNSGLTFAAEAPPISIQSSDNPDVKMVVLKSSLKNVAPLTFTFTFKKGFLSTVGVNGQDSVDVSLETQSFLNKLVQDKDLLKALQEGNTGGVAAALNPEIDSIVQKVLLATADSLATPETGRGVYKAVINQLNPLAVAKKVAKAGQDAGQYVTRNLGRWGYSAFNLAVVISLVVNTAFLIPTMMDGATWSESLWNGSQIMLVDGALLTFRQLVLSKRATDFFRIVARKLHVKAENSRGPTPPSGASKNSCLLALRALFK